MNPVNTTVAIDPQIKSKASARAKKDQLSISSVIRLLLLDYAEGRIQIGTRPAFTENGLTLEAESALLLAEREARAGKNMSPNLEGAEAVEAYLKALK